jgi:Cell division protein CrgA
MCKSAHPARALQRPGRVGPACPRLALTLHARARPVGSGRTTRATADQETTVPKSRVRNKTVYTPPPRSAKSKVSPRWLVPTMVGCLLVGLAWIALYYVTGQNLPVAALAQWNLLIGFGFIVAGLGLATRWR